MIGFVTGAIGLLPTYFSIGVAAPVLLTLLRLLQGVAVGGEWAGAVTLAVEHAPKEHRGRYAAMPQIGSPIGTLLSSGPSWRCRCCLPLPQLLVGAGPTLLGVGGYYLITTFVISYGTGTLGLNRSVLLSATLVAAVVEIVVLVIGGRVAERYGPGRVTVIGGLVSAVVAFPTFWLIDTTNTPLVIIGVTLAVACLSIPYAVSGALLTDLFPARLRYSGVALSANVASVVSGFVPLLATALLTVSDGRSWTPALMLVVIALITAASGALAPRLSLGHDEVVAR
jgi:MFS family permease